MLNCQIRKDRPLIQLNEPKRVKENVIDVSTKVKYCMGRKTQWIKYTYYIDPHFTKKTKLRSPSLIIGMLIGMIYIWLKTCPDLTEAYTP